MHASESTLDSQPLESTRHAGISSPYQYGRRFVAEAMSNYLTTDGLKKIFSPSGGPQRPEARGICHICHMVNPALRLSFVLHNMYQWITTTRVRLLTEYLPQQIPEISNFRKVKYV